MNQVTLQNYFFGALLLGAFVLAFLMLSPFFVAVALAAVFATVLNPLYERLRRFRLGPRVAALGVILLVVIVVGVLASLLLTRVFGEARTLYDVVSSGQTSYLEDFSALTEQTIGVWLPGVNLDLRAYLSEATSWLVEHLGLVFSGTLGFLLKSLLFLLALFFFLKDGARFRRSLVELSPLGDHSDEEILAQLKQTTNAVVRGFLLVALIQGTLAGVGLALFGVPNPTLWGSVAAFAALIPAAGTGLVMIPAVLYLWWQGSVWGALGLLIWGGVIVGLVDNFLAPVLYSRGGPSHPLFMLLAVLGGLALFGPAGFILGPLVLSLLLVLVGIYRRGASGIRADA